MIIIQNRSQKIAGIGKKQYLCPLKPTDHGSDQQRLQGKPVKVHRLCTQRRGRDTQIAGRKRQANTRRHK